MSEKIPFRIMGLILILFSGICYSTQFAWQWYGITSLDRSFFFTITVVSLILGLRLIFIGKKFYDRIESGKDISRFFYETIFLSIMSVLLIIMVIFNLIPLVDQKIMGDLNLFFLHAFY